MQVLFLEASKMASCIKRLAFASKFCQMDIALCYSGFITCLLCTMYSCGFKQTVASTMEVCICRFSTQIGCVETKNVFFFDAAASFEDEGAKT